METNSKLFPLQIVELEKEYLANKYLDERETYDLAQKLNLKVEWNPLLCTLCPEVLVLYDFDQEVVSDTSARDCDCIFKAKLQFHFRLTNIC